MAKRELILSKCWFQHLPGLQQNAVLGGVMHCMLTCLTSIGPFSSDGISLCNIISYLPFPESLLLTMSQLHDAAFTSLLP